MSCYDVRVVLKPDRYAAYAVAGVAVIVATLLRWLLGSMLDTSVPFVMHFLAIVVAAWYGGTRPALAATAVSLVLTWYFFIPRQYSFAIGHTSDAVALMTFAIIGTSISYLGGRMRVVEEVARQAEALHRVTIASIGDAVITTDSAERVTGMNRIAAELCRWSEEEARTRPLAEVLRLVNEDTRLPVENPVSKVIAHGRIIGLANHTILVARDGSERPIDDSAAPIRDEDGNIIGVVMVFRDISERRATEISLERLAAIVESSDDAIISKDLNGIVTSWNNAAEQIFGYSAEEMIGRSIKTLIPFARLEEEEQILERLRQGKKIDHYETMRQTKGGQLIHVSLSISPLRDGTGELIGASKIARDITSRKKAELARRESEGRFMTFMQALPGLAWIKDLEGRYVFVNNAAEIAFRHPRKNLYGSTDEELFPPEIAAEFRAHDRMALASKHGIEVIETLPQEDGIHHSLVSKFPIPGVNGENAFVGGVAIDVTDRLRAEEELRKANRKKDEFLATLAHELRNPLTPIRNATRLLQDSPEIDEPVRAAVDMLDRQSRQMIRLIDDLLDVSRISRGKIKLQCEPIELEVVLKQSLETARPLFEHRQQNLQLELPGNPIYLNADPVRMSQIIGNLLNNASKFTPVGGRIRLIADRDDLDAIISVEDNGIGIAADDLPHIFEIFSQIETSLEGRRDGLGIGLHLVKNLVELHGGRLEVYSEGLGKGTRFVVRIPLASRPLSPREDGYSPQVVSPEPQRILVVDDNIDAATSLAFLLQDLGHDVHLAHDGLQAVDMTRELQPQVVLLDIGLPKLNGYDTGRIIRESDPDRRIVLVALTGWGTPEDRRRSQAAGFDAHLVKPIDLPELLQAIRQRSSEMA